MTGLRPGSGRCVCAGCGRAFSGPSAFDRHQELTGPRADPTLVCRDPAAVGLVERDGRWSWPGMTPAEVARKAAGARQGAAKTA